MSDPNDKQKCGTCKGEGYLFTEECPSCAPRVDGSAAEVKRYYAFAESMNRYPALAQEAWVRASAYDAVVAENKALRNLANNLQPGPISEALVGARYERESQLIARVAELERLLQRCYNEPLTSRRLIDDIDAALSRSADVSRFSTTHNQDYGNN